MEWLALAGITISCGVVCCSLIYALLQRIRVLEYKLDHLSGFIYEKDELEDA